MGHGRPVMNTEKTICDYLFRNGVMKILKMKNSTKPIFEDFNY